MQDFHPLAFGELPQPALDDDHEANTALSLMSAFETAPRRAQWFAYAARAFAKAEARGCK